MKYNISEIMKRAWEIKKEDEANLFSECLKMAWAEARNILNISVKYIIPDWFMNKSFNSSTRNLCRLSSVFTKENIVKETEKALLVALDAEAVSTGSTFRQNLWVPKSIVK